MQVILAVFLVTKENQKISAKIISQMIRLNWIVLQKQMEKSQMEESMETSIYLEL